MGTDTAEPAPNRLDEAYGVGRMQLPETLQVTARARMKAFVDECRLLPEVQAIMASLSANERAQFDQCEVEHLLLLLDPDLDADTHRQHAERIGRDYAHAGLPIYALIGTHRLYQSGIQRLVRENIVKAERLGDILQVLHRRLLLDIEAQCAAYQQLAQCRAAVLATVRRAARRAEKLQDLHVQALEALARLPALAAAFLAKPDAHGRLEIEASTGKFAQTYLAALKDGKIPHIQVGGKYSDSNEPAAQAWACGEICVAKPHMLEPLLALREDADASPCIRAAAAIPLLDDSGNAFALLLLYGKVPGCFSAPNRQEFLTHVQQTLRESALRPSLGEVVSPTRRCYFSERLHAGRVRMVYQPIVALNSGNLLKVEALARLIDESEALLCPDLFLPTFDQSDLFKLFELGLRQVCQDQKDWAAQGLTVAVALNLPPQGVSDRAYYDILFRVMREHGADAKSIELEILETADDDDSAARENFFASLRALGMRIVQDDLGSGYSSLLRMESMPFDSVKIDRALVLRSVRKDPQRTLEFIHHLTQLAHSLEVSVTVEGLEDKGLLEAAAILGADAGQGYFIARPMPADALRNWLASHSHAVNVGCPQTALGAMAGQLLWERQLAALRPWPQLTAEFVRTKSLLQRYLEQAPPGATGLSKLLDRHHALALRNDPDERYADSRRRLVAALSALVHV